MNIPPDMQRRRTFEDRFAQLGAERSAIQQQMGANTQAIIVALGDAKGTGIPYEQVAALLGVSRQSVFNWREIADRSASGQATAEKVARKNG